VCSVLAIAAAGLHAAGVNHAHQSLKQHALRFFSLSLFTVYSLHHLHTVPSYLLRPSWGLSRSSVIVADVPLHHCILIGPPRQLQALKR
jgi:hypothetical protein